ncbi:hypothetical protein [Mesorhizobium sp.]|uniref:hypothetical protein n=1 Tax=Mesorhizobium sp. TaxID=1871066 RepID=UPI0024785881|nr:MULTISPECIES: hypothetical protein [unclassified Mesorhizobium]
MRGTDTAPEMLVRKLVHATGYRYRLHRQGLSGKHNLGRIPGSQEGHLLYTGAIDITRRGLSKAQILGRLHEHLQECPSDAAASRADVPRHC